MSIRKKLGLGIASGVLGLTLVTGGTFAYFSDTAVSDNSFASGTLELNVSNQYGGFPFNVTNMKPGDKSYKEFKLSNNGTLDMAKVLFYLGDVKVTKDGAAVDQALADKFLDSLRINILTRENANGQWINNSILNNVYNGGSAQKITLKDFRDGGFEGSIKPAYWDDGKGKINLVRDLPLEAGSWNSYQIQVEFVDNNQDQNDLQGLKVDLEFVYEALQGAGGNK